MIIRNSARCLKCLDEIESTYRHDFKYCKCGAIFVDGGRAYIRRGATDWNDLEETSIEVDSFATVDELVATLFHDNVHPREACKGPYCVIHSPSDHHMRTWPVAWEDNSIQRMCPHENPHADPDTPDPYCYQCDGCCQGSA